jgi:hypothetical protein
MPKKIIRKIEREYEAKGKSPKKAKAIAYATLNKEGLLDKPKKRKKSKRRKK